MLPAQKTKVMLLIGLALAAVVVGVVCRLAVASIQTRVGSTKSTLGFLFSDEFKDPKKGLILGGLVSAILIGVISLSLVVHIVRSSKQEAAGRAGSGTQSP